jgi:hypothetical protein
MGSFNTSCAISNLSINYNDEIVFLPLEAVKTFQTNEVVSLPNRHFLLDNSSLYKPAFLPIKGSYNDYGSIENIVHDENIGILEKKYNLNINEIIILMTGRRTGINHLSSASSIFKIKDLRKETFNTDSLLNLGFSRKNSVDIIYINDSNDFGLVFNEKKDDTDFVDIKLYKIIDDKLKFHDKRTILNKLSELQDLIFNEFDIIISLEKEGNKEIVQTIKELNSLSGMFIHKGIYDTFICNSFSGEEIIENKLDDDLNKHYLKGLGFKYIDTGYQNKYSERKCDIYKREGNDNVVKMSHYGCELNDDSYTIYTLGDFIKKWEELTDEFLHINNLKGISVKAESLKESISKFYIQKKDSNDDNKIIQRMLFNNLKNSIKEIIGFDYSHSSIFFKTYIDNILEIQSNNIFDSIDELVKLSSTMYSTNKIFFPGLNGEQFGNNELSKMLCLKSLSIINKLESDYDKTLVEYYLEDKDIDEAKELFEECVEEYTDKEGLTITGLSKYEFNLVKDDIRLLEEILHTYL